MGKDEPIWLKYPRTLIRQGTTYLKKHGYADHDVYELAHPEDKPESEIRNILKPDDSPKAEIVAIAGMICLAQWVLSAWEQGDHDMVAEFMYYLGHKEAEAKIFARFPGITADTALDPEGFLWISSTAKRLSLKEIEGDINLTHTRTTHLEKIKAEVGERNKHICFKAQEYLHDGVEPRDVTKMVSGYFMRKNLWAKYQKDGKPLSTKQMRKIIREGTDMPPARKKENT